MVLILLKNVTKEIQPPKHLLLKYFEYSEIPPSCIMFKCTLYMY